MFWADRFWTNPNKSWVTKNVRVSAVLVGAALFLGINATALAQAEQTDGETLSYFIELPEDIVSLSHGGAVGLARAPETIEPLKNQSLALTNHLRDQNGVIVGIASELEDFTGDKGPASGEPWDTYWTLIILGHGALFLHEKEQLDETVAGIFTNTATSGKDWEGAYTAPSNVGPAPSGHGIIVGGTGAFEGTKGTFQEIGTLRKFTTTGKIEATIELRMHLQ